MNLILLFPEDLLDEQTAIVQGRQLAHIQQTLKSKVGDQLCVGLVNGKIGSGELISLDERQGILRIEWSEISPKALPVTLIIALPRPKMLRRIIQTASTMGVKRLYFINSWKVEKSFWQTPWLSEEKLIENCIIGLEQAVDTIMPEIHLRKLFKPFVEDELPDICHNTLKLVAHPGESEKCPHHISQPCTLVIGPEGGFTPYEVSKLKEAGFNGVHLGPRILRVETAVPVLLSRLFDC